MSFWMRLKLALRVLFGGGELVRLPVAGLGDPAGAGHPVPADDRAAMARQMRIAMERMLAAKIYVAWLGSTGVDIVDGDIVDLAEFARRAARLYCNGEDFGG